MSRAKYAVARCRISFRRSKLLVAPAHLRHLGLVAGGEVDDEVLGRPPSRSAMAGQRARQDSEVPTLRAT